MRIARRRRLLSAAAVTLAGTGAAVVGMPTSSSPLGARPAAAATVTPRLVWSKTIPGAAIRESSPTVATLDSGGPAMVVGSLNHNVYAFHLADGSAVAGWPVSTSNEVDSSPSVADVDGSGQPEVFVGSGSYDTPGGAYYSFTHDGHLRWRYQGSDPNQSSEAVFSTMALGDINADGAPDATAGALGLQMYSLNAISGGVNPGWPYYTDDTVFSSPALTDLDNNGQTEVVIGGDSTPGGTIDHRGGLVRALDGAGHVIWQYFTDEIVRSSPSVADLDGSGFPEIAFGTGAYWVNQPGGAIDSTYLFLLNHDGSLRWKHNLNGYTLASPALADLTGSGQLDVVEPTAGPGTTGQVWALDPNGNVLPGFPVNPGVGIIVGGVATADLTGGGAQDILVGTGAGLFAYDGHGNQLFSELPGNFGLQNTPLVTQDPNGTIGITVAGSDHTGDGVIFHYEITTGKGMGALSWPMFRHDPRRTGSFTNPPLARSYCPANGTGGYRFVASDGGVFAFCGASFYGSMGGHPLAAPIVGMASTPDDRGYWLVASDGGIFTFGDAVFRGSTGSLHLAAPIVGMARTPDGGGYWLVASDGGIFTFGDAVFRGSTGAIHLNQPIVGMAPTPDGGGYWLVARDGGIFSFGDAVFRGSTGAIHLNQPIVGMASTPDGGGYWLVASDGGIFSFGDAGFHGSAGAIRLAKPVVGMAATSTGQGYWLVASDGGIFTYGDAVFYGSTGALALAAPIVGMAR
ncbi:MAG TPA: hypothetical protein VFA11_11660 [Acidimicrobiales bacterium]|nr:hypothetical protein [Acidimicrobiales bacterium]